MAVVLIAPAMPAMLQHFAAVPHVEQLATFSLTAPALCVAILSPFAGWLVDRLGRRTPLLLSLPFYALMGTAPLYLSSIYWVIASRIGVGIAETILLTASITMLGDLFDGHERERYLSFNTAIASLSATAFFAIGGFLGTASWRLPYVVYGLALIFFVAVLVCTWEPPVRRAIDPAPGGVTPRFPLVPLLTICAVTIAGGIIFMLPNIQIGTIAAAYGFTSPATAGMIGAVGSIAMPVGAFGFNYARRRGISVPALVIFAFLCTGAGLLLVARLQGLPALTFSIVLHQFGCGFMLTGLIAWALSLLPQELRGRGMGAYFTSFFIAQPICGFLFAVVEQAVGSTLDATGIFGVFAVMCGVLLAIGRRWSGPDSAKADLSPVLNHPH